MIRLFIPPYKGHPEHEPSCPGRHGIGQFEVPVKFVGFGGTGGTGLTLIGVALVAGGGRGGPAETEGVGVVDVDFSCDVIGAGGLVGWGPGRGVDGVPGLMTEMGAIGAIGATGDGIGLAAPVACPGGLAGLAPGADP